MTCSPAQLDANRKNAALSTGPRTPEGKAASRANSLKHGLTGDGIVVPEKNLLRIAAVAQNIREEYHPETEIGQAMADRAAMLLIRLDRAGLHELAMVNDQVLGAIYDFNQARRDWADDLFDDLDANPGAIFELHRFPEGIDRLIEGWSTLGAIDNWSSEDLARVALLSEPGADDGIAVRAHIPDLIERLEASKAAIDRRPIDRARKQAADLALFSDSPQAILARRYEASTERAYHKAIKTLREAEDSKESAFDVPETPQTPAAAIALGSFGRETLPPPQPRRLPEPGIELVAPKPPVDRAKRPDPKKLRESQRRKRR